jgi:hypothetical protein
MEGSKNRYKIKREVSQKVNKTFSCEFQRVKLLVGRNLLNNWAILRSEQLLKLMIQIVVL